jgi:hypothetical protein
MRRRWEHGTPRPLPRGWLPDPYSPEGDPKWDQSVERIMVAARPELRRLRSERSAAEVTWWSMMALWWKPAAALATASAAILVLVGRPRVPPEPPPGSIPLGLVASDGDPVTLWGALGIQADPVLAQIAIREQGDIAGQESRPDTPEERTR